MRILLIEDNPGDARLVLEMLKEVPGDFTLEVAERLAAGLKLLASHDFDVALLDLNLPDSNGLETLARLQSKFPHLPIVVKTSVDDEALAIQSTRQGAEDYLVKGQVDGRLLRRALLNSIERKQMREELAKARDELETRVKERTADLNEAYEELWLQSAILDLATDAIFIRNADNNFVYVNQAACHIYGYAKEELLGMNYKQMIAPQETAYYEARVNQTPTEGQLSLETLHVRKDGSVFPVEVNSRMVKTMQGDFIVSVLRDITERKRAEKEMRALSKRLIEVQEEERRTFARELHDEVGQNLTIIKIMLDRIIRAFPNFASALGEVAAQMTQAIQQVRNLSLDLRPGMLDDLGLVPALLWLFDRLNTQSGPESHF